MAVIRLEISDAGIRPIGFFSRDRADEAIAELQALLLRLSSDRRPVAVRWRRESERLVPHKAPFFDAEQASFVSWDADAGVLAGEAAGAPFEARAEGDTFAITWGGQPLCATTDGWIDASGDRLGPDGTLRLAVDRRARVGAGGIAVVIGLDHDGAVPAEAVVRAAWCGAGGEIDLGLPSRDGAIFRWGVPERAAWPAEPWSLRITTDLELDGPSDATIALVEATAFTGVEVVGAPFVVPGEPIPALRFAHEPGAAAPAKMRVNVGADAVAVIAGRNEGFADYRLEPSLTLPVGMSVPARIPVRCEGQDDAIGALIAGPREVRAAWRVVRDERGNARMPRVSADCLVPVGVRGRFTPTPDGRVRVESDGIAVEAPLADDAFAPLLASDPTRPVWAGALTGIAGPAIAWIPGYPPVEVPFDADGRVRPRGPALEEFAREAARRGMPLRFEAGGGRAIVHPADGVVTGDEIAPSGGRLSLHGTGELAYVLWFRGLIAPCKVVALGPESDQRILQLEKPLPCDGRLGHDVGPFLPVRVLELPDGARIVDGRRQVRVVPHGDRVRSASPEPAFLFESRYGFHPDAPREPLGRYAFHGLVVSRESNGWWFHGWLLDPGFDAPASGPWPAYGFRAGPAAGDIVRIAPAGPRPSIAPAVIAIADAMLADGSRAPRSFVCDDGDFALTPIFDDPRRPAVWIEVEAIGGRPIPAVRLFRRP